MVQLPRIECVSGIELRLFGTLFNSFYKFLKIELMRKKRLQKMTNIWYYLQKQCKFEKFDFKC